MSKAASTAGSRAVRPGSRAGLAIIAGLVAACLGGFCYFLLATHSSAAIRPRSSADTYGGLPSWLPKATVPVGRVLPASAARPQLGIEGDTMDVHVGRAVVTVTAVGPQVPEEGQFPVPKTSPCAFDVTFTGASGPVPLRFRDFTVLDELGQLHYLRLASTKGGRPPTQVQPGQTVTLVMSAVLPTGSGTLRWSPQAPKPIASWDFDVEID